MASMARLCRTAQSTKLFKTNISSLGAPVVSRQSLYPFAALVRCYASKSWPEHQILDMPALSPTMTQGSIGNWKVKPGDNLEPGMVLVEIETDKTQMDFEYQDEGRIAKILKETGTKDLSIGSPIAVIVPVDADIAPFESFTVEDAGGDAKPSEPKKEESKPAEKTEEAESTSSDSSPGSEIVSQESDSSGSRLETALDRSPKVSPAVKKIALEKGVPLSQIKGTGKGGAVTKEDVEKYSGGSSASSAGSSSGPVYEDTPASAMRKTIASRLVQSTQTNPHYFVQSTVSASKLLKLRAALNASSNGSYKLSVNDFLIKAIALAAQKVPAANASWREEGGQTVIRTHHTVDVSVAVATPVGLITPVVKNAHSLGLEAISATVKDLGKRARDNKLKTEEYQGGTITISNMGMNEAVERFTAVINPPQATIIAVGTVKKVAVPEIAEEGEEPGIKWDDQIVLSGSFDHKVVDGAVGGEYMKALKSIVEDPLKLLL